MRKQLIWLAFVLLPQAVFGESQVTVNFSLPEQQTSDYRRPYVAVWVESEGKLVRNIALWADEEDWFKDLRKWWRKSGRYLQSVDGFSSATRKPGNYQVSWDLKDEKGQLVADGEYQIMIEAAREYGSRSLQKQRVKIGHQHNIKLPLKPSIELGEGYITIGDKE